MPETSDKTAARGESEPELVLIPGDTYPVRAELKTLGAVWDRAERVWRIEPEKLALATALVEHQALAPPTLGEQVTSGGGVDALSDPFEDEGDGPRTVTLTRSDGNLYAAREALRAIGANWNKERRVWTIREDKADYARAIVRSATTTASTDAPLVTDTSTAPAPRAVPTPPRERERPPTTAAGPPTPTPMRRPEPAVPASVTPVVAAPTPPTDRIRLGGLWHNRTKDGRQYMAGRLSATVRLLVFKNEFKTNDSQPDYIMYLAPVENESAEQEPRAPESA